MKLPCIPGRLSNTKPQKTLQNKSHSYSRAFFEALIDRQTPQVLGPSKGGKSVSVLRARFTSPLSSSRSATIATSYYHTTNWPSSADQSTPATFHEMRESLNSTPTRARVAAFALRARGMEGAVGANSNSS